MNVPNSIQCVFLDRDGVINQAPPNGEYVTQCSELILAPGVPQAIRRLNEAGIKVIVITNQRGVSQGLYTHEGLARIHQHLQQQLLEAGAHLDAIYYCPHDRDCQFCRKPATGLFRQAFAEYPGITPEGSVMIGDSQTDMQAGRAVGAYTIMVGSRDGVAAGGEIDAIAPSLAEAVEQLLTGDD